MDSTLIPTCSGIYKITCVPTGRIYIGSALCLRDRWQMHCRELCRNVHGNRFLQRAWVKYGEDAFEFSVLEYVLIPEMLTAREQFFFGKLRPFGKRGFNIATIAGSQLGIKFSPESRERLKVSHMGNTSALGHVCTPEAKKLMRLAKLGKKQREEHVRQRSKSNTGKKRTPESKEKMRIKALERRHTKESCEKMSISRSKTIVVTAPDGTEYIAHGIAKFCEEHGLCSSSLARVAKGEYKQHKGWKARYIDNEG